MLVVSQPELRSRSEPVTEQHLHQRRRTDGVTEDAEVGKKYFDELVMLGMAIGWVLLVLVAITIVLSIFYRPFYVTQIEAEASDQLSERGNSLDQQSTGKLPESLGDIEFLNNQSDWSHKSPDENRALPRTNSARERANEKFVRGPEIGSNPVFDYSTPIVTPFVRRRIGASEIKKKGGMKYTLCDSGEKKELKVPNDKNLVFSSSTSKGTDSSLNEKRAPRKQASQMGREMIHSLLAAYQTFSEKEMHQRVWMTGKQQGAPLEYKRRSTQNQLRKMSEDMEGEGPLSVCVRTLALD